MNLIFCLFLIFLLLNAISMKESQTFLLDSTNFRIQLENGEYYYISLSHSKLISNGESNLKDIHITDDDCYPSKRYKSGMIGTKDFKFKNGLNINLNYVFYNDEGKKNYLGLARGVQYDTDEIKEKYELDFLTNLKNQKEIDKYYIYFPPLFTSDKTKTPNPYILIGAIPSIFNLYQNKTSYAPLSPNYPTKWSIRLSHILYEINSDSNNTQSGKVSIDCDVIFTESGDSAIYIPYKHKSIFDDIFTTKLGCSESSSNYQCSKSKLNIFKLYLVFNGFSHLISNSLIFNLFWSTPRSDYIIFKEDIDFIGIDTYTMGNYHKLFDGENNMIMLLNTEGGKDIADVSDICGYENRDGIRRIVHDPEYLILWEQRLKNESQIINKTLEEIEALKMEWNETKNKIEEEKKELEKEIEKYRQDIIRQEIDNLREDLNSRENDKNKLNKEIDNLREDLKIKENDKEKFNNEIINLRNDLTKREEDNKTLNEQISKNNSLLIIIISNLVISLITIVLIFLCFSRAKKIEKQKQDFQDFNILEDK